MVRRDRNAVKFVREEPLTLPAPNDTQVSIHNQLGLRPNCATAWPTYLLSQSIRDLGVLVPVLYLRGELLDGARREAHAAAQRRPCPRVDLPSERHAARLLWRLHPERAWQRFVRRGMRRLAIADLMGVPLEELPDRRLIHAWLRVGSQRPK